jgi:hypothetical protein
MTEHGAARLIVRLSFELMLVFRGHEGSREMTGKTIRELTLDAIDQALAESIRQQFISMVLADPTDDGGTPLALKRFNRSLPRLADLHKRARTMVGDVFKEETP